MLMQILAGGGDLPQTIIIPQDPEWTVIAVALASIIVATLAILSYRCRNK